LLGEVAFLCHALSGNGIKVDSKKTEAMKNWHRPLITSAIQSFLGLAGYYEVCEWFLFYCFSYD
ncbi:hypothetical protein L3H42_11150, partial [Corynebacterium sp. MC-13]|nr:hypothetical protein [Corynebacterium parakroppenstedtii]